MDAIKDGYIKNCYLASRNEETIFIDNGDGTISARLDGYAIVPLEDYEESLDNVRKTLEERAAGRK